MFRRRKQHRDGHCLASFSVRPESPRVSVAPESLTTEFTEGHGDARMGITRGSQCFPSPCGSVVLRELRGEPFTPVSPPGLRGRTLRDSKGSVFHAPVRGNGWILVRAVPVERQGNDTTKTQRHKDTKTQRSNRAFKKGVFVPLCLCGVIPAGRGPRTGIGPCAYQSIALVSPSVGRKDRFLNTDFKGDATDYTERGGTVRGFFLRRGRWMRSMALRAGGRDAACFAKSGLSGQRSRAVLTPPGGGRCR